MNNLDAIKEDIESIKDIMLAIVASIEDGDVDLKHIKWTIEDLGN